MTKIPKDPMILLGYINTQLRDFYPDMGELCAALSLDRAEIDRLLSAADFRYDPEKNQYF
ncbi:MAG: DUF4250 domain-containing protein [Lachnospiraceae bacterium]|jgi:hypothetical protein|nr:DUF4250 domain-containing protein [Lachnospiraceae bacterium]